MTRSVLLLVTTLGALTIAGCGGSSETVAKNAGDARRKDALKKDINRDGIPDVWRHMVEEDGKQVVGMVEFDINFDGKVDVVRTFSKGVKIREEMDMDFDGKFDVVNLFENGQIVRKEMDLHFDSKPDIIKYYTDGQITRLESDSDGDGQIDYWEYYKNGKLSRKGSDEDGDGKPDDNRWIDSEG